jgi:transposase
MPDRLNRHDLSDEEWERLRVLLPSGPQQRGGRRADHRTVINGIFFRTRAGCPWRDLPEGFGNFMWNQMAGCQGLLLRASWP